MASRTVDINIKYNINVVDVQRAETASAKAQQATDNLRAATTKAAQSAAASYKQFQGSIETLNAKVLSLKEQITRSSDPAVVRKLSDEYKRLKTQLDAANKSAFDTGKALQSTKTGTTSLTSEFSKLYTAARLFVTAGIVKETVDMALNMSKLAGNIEGVKRAFDKLDNSTILFENLRKATHGTIDDLTLMQKAVQAKNFKIPLDQLATLLEFASIKAQQTGLDINYLTDSLITGLGRNSIRLLDNLQISVTELRKKTKELGSQQEAVFAIVNEQMQKMGAYTENAATKTDQLTTAWENLKQTISKAFESGVVPGFLTNSLEGIRAIVQAVKIDWKTAWIPFYGGAKTIKDTIDNIQKLATEEYALANAIKTAQDIEKKATGTKQERFDYIQQEINSRLEIIGGYNDTIRALRQQREELVKSRYAGNEYRASQDAQYISIQKNIEGYKASRTELIATNKILKEYLDSINRPAEGGPLDTLAELEQKLKDLKDAEKEIAGISTKAGIEEARINKQEIKATEDKIEKIKLQIYWEEELQRRRSTINKEETKDIEELIKQQDEYTEKQKKKDFTKSLVTGSGTGQADLTKAPQLSNDIKIKVTPYIPEDSWDKIKDSIHKNLPSIMNQAEQIISDIAQFEINRETQKYDYLINMAQKHYDKQLALAGDNEKEKEKIRQKEQRDLEMLTRKRADSEKKAALASIEVNTALGIIKAISTAATIYDGLVESLLVAATGAAQYAIASKTQYYAEGGIDIKGGVKGKDSIPAMLMPGESVMTTKETTRARNVLELVRANRLDDSILKDLQISATGVKNIAMSDERIVEAIKSQKQVDYFTIGSTLYEAKKTHDGLSKKIRRKSMGNG